MTIADLLSNAVNYRIGLIEHLRAKHGLTKERGYLSTTAWSIAHRLAHEMERRNR